LANQDSSFVRSGDKPLPLGNLWYKDFGTDACYALPQLHRNPSFAALAVLTLALGIGGNTAIFSLVDAMIFRELPVRHPEQLVLLHWAGPESKSWHSYSSLTGCDAWQLGVASVGCSFSYPEFDLFRTQARSLDGILGFAAPASVQATIRGEIVSTSVEVVSGEFFSTLGVRLGRAALSLVTTTSRGPSR
jgi:hypothetical protein